MCWKGQLLLTPANPVDIMQRHYCIKQSLHAEAPLAHKPVGSALHMHYNCNGQQQGNGLKAAAALQLFSK